MKTHRIALALLAALGLAGIATAQAITAAPASNSGSPGALSATLQMELPESSNAWTLHVVESGGFAGKMREIVVGSQGSLGCVGLAVCVTNLVPMDLQRLEALLTESAKKNWAQIPPVDENAPVSACNDCKQYWMELRFRAADGKIKLHTTVWDDVSWSRLPAEVRRIYDAVAALAK